MFFFFFFQAEDGIRDLYVTGVQTCALPILLEEEHGEAPPALQLEGERLHLEGEIDGLRDAHHLARMGSLELRDEAAEALVGGVLDHRSSLADSRAWLRSARCCLDHTPLPGGSRRQLPGTSPRLDGWVFRRCGAPSSAS